MKKVIVLASLILGFTLTSMSVSAQTAAKTATPQKQQTTQTTQTQKSKFIDQNHDGVCDRHQKGKNMQCGSFTDKNGDKICDNCQGKGTCTKGTSCPRTADCKSACPSSQGKSCCGQHGKTGCSEPKK